MNKTEPKLSLLYFHTSMLTHLPILMQIFFCKFYCPNYHKAKNERNTFSQKCHIACDKHCAQHSTYMTKACS